MQMHGDRKPDMKDIPLISRESVGVPVENISGTDNRRTPELLEQPNVEVVNPTTVEYENNDPVIPNSPADQPTVGAVDKKIDSVPDYSGVLSNYTRKMGEGDAVVLAKIADGLTDLRDSVNG